MRDVIGIDICFFLSAICSAQPQWGMDDVLQGALHAASFMDITQAAQQIQQQPKVLLGEGSASFSRLQALQ